MYSSYAVLDSLHDDLSGTDELNSISSMNSTHLLFQSFFFLRISCAHGEFIGDVIIANPLKLIVLQHGAH